MVAVFGPRCGDVLRHDSMLARQITLELARCRPGWLVPVLVDGTSVADLAGLPGGLAALASVQALYWDGSADTATRLATFVKAQCAQRRGTTALRRMDDELGRIATEEAAIGGELDAVRGIIADNIGKTFGGLE